jgi:hypothetical protein
MSFVIAAPETMTAAAADLAAIGSNVDAAHVVAATRTTSVLPAAADEVSASIAHLFSRHAANYQATAAQAAAFSDQFVQHLKTGAGSYAGAEAAAAASLQPLTAPAAFLDLLNVLPLLAANLPNLLFQVAADPLLIFPLLGALGGVVALFGPVLLIALVGLLLSEAGPQLRTLFAGFGIPL